MIFYDFFLLLFSLFTFQKRIRFYYKLVFIYYFILYLPSVFLCCVLFCFVFEFHYMFITFLQVSNDYIIVEAMQVQGFVFSVFSYPYLRSIFHFVSIIKEEGTIDKTSYLFLWLHAGCWVDDGCFCESNWPSVGWFYI